MLALSALGTLLRISADQKKVLKVWFMASFCWRVLKVITLFILRNIQELNLDQMKIIPLSGAFKNGAYFGYWI
jgi:hypothetical protein